MRALAPTKRSAWIAAGLICAPAAFFLAPESNLACEDDPWLSQRSPDGDWTLTVCRRPKFFSMPGGSSDAPGWIVLRDSAGAIRGVVHLGWMQLLAESGPAGGTVWRPKNVVLSGLATLPLRPAAAAPTRWFMDRLWRVRAFLGLVASDEISTHH